MRRPEQSATHIDRSARVIGYLCTLMRAGTLRAGDSIPSETELAEALKIRCSHAREGIACLCTLGVFRVCPGGAIVLAEGSAPILPELLSALHVSKPGEVEEARWLVAPQLAALAARRATENDHTAMAEEVAEMYAATNRSDHLEHALRFQQRMARSAGNSLLGAFAEALLLPVSGEHGKDGDIALDLRESARIHSEIYRAIRRHRACDAKKAMEEQGRLAVQSSGFQPRGAEEEEMPRRTGT